MAEDGFDGFLGYIVLVLAAGVPREMDGLDGLTGCEFAARSCLVGGFTAHQEAGICLDDENRLR
jgi:hypothetical protein